MLDQILAQIPVEGEEQQLEAEIEPLIAMGEQVLAGGDGERAAGIFRQIVDMAPGNAEAVSGLARALIAAGRTDEARALLDAVPENQGSDPAIARARSALELASAAPQDADTGEFERRRSGRS
jgi:putative thioredoxin